MAWGAILLLSVLAAVTYGVIHDQITARLCVEYFTVGHPPKFATDDPTLLALGWGVIATWWVGLMLGIILAVAAREGRRPKRTVRSLIRPVIILMVVTGFFALLAGVVAWNLADSGTLTLREPLAGKVPAGKHAAYIAAGAAHMASYLVGAAGGVALSLIVWRSREYGYGARFVKK